MLAPFRHIYPTYSSLLGYIGLSVEATLPLPQMFANHRSRSCKGFRLSVLAMWLLGDAMKMYWFFTSSGEIGWPFKLCGIFQAGCDCFLGVQYLMYGSGESPKQQNNPSNYQPMAYPVGMYKHQLSKLPSGRNTPTGRRTPVGEKAL